MLSKRIWIAVLRIVGLSCVAAWVALAMYFTVARPMAADVAQGLVYAMPAHGPPVYTSIYDQSLLWGLPAVFLLCGWISTKVQPTSLLLDGGAVRTRQRTD
jgi:hypothetical protein